MPLDTVAPSAPYTLDDIPATASEVRSATWEQAITDLPGYSAIRAIDLSQMHRFTFDNNRFSPTEADYFMEERGLKGEFKFDRDYNELELNMLASRKRAEVQRREILSRTEGSGSSALGRFSIALASNFLDPIAVGSAFVPVVGESRYALMLERAGSALSRAGVRAGVGFAEGVVGSALVEPLIAGAKAQEQADYRFADSFMNVTIGGVFGGGLHVGGGLLRDVTVGAPKAQAARIAEEIEPAHSSIPVMSEADQALATRVINAREELQAVHGDIMRQANEVLDREVAALRSTAEPAPGKSWGDLETLATEQRQKVDAYAGRIAADYEPAAVRAEIDRLTKDPEYVAALRSKYRQRNVSDRIARQAKENVTTRRTVLETKQAEQRVELEQTQAQVDAHRVKNAADQRLEFIRVFRQTDDARKLLEALPPEAQERLRSRLESATKEAATLLESPEARALVEKHPPAQWIVANSDPRVRETAMRVLAAQAATGETLEVRPVFDSSTMAEAGRRLADPDQAPLSDAGSVTRADEALAGPDPVDIVTVQKTVADLEAQVKAMQDEAGIGAEEAIELLEGIREDVETAKASLANVPELARAAAMIAACALGHAI